MDWFKKLVQVGQSVLKSSDVVKNPDNLDREFIECITKYMKPMVERDSVLGMALLRFIIDGTDDEALLQLAGTPTALTDLGFGGSNYQYRAASARTRGLIFQGKWKAPAQVWLRLGALVAIGQKASNITVQVPNNWQLPVATLLLEIVSAYHQYSRDTATFTAFSALDLEAIFVACGMPADALIIPLLDGQSSQAFRPSYYYSRTSNVCLVDVDTYCSKYLEAVNAFLQHATAEQRVNAFNTLSMVNFDFGDQINLLVTLGISQHKTVREAAFPLLLKYRERAKLVGNADVLLPVLQGKLKEGGASERNETVGVMWRLYGTDCASALQEHLRHEKAERVKQTIQKYLAVPRATASAPEPLVLPPVEVELGSVPLSDGAKQGILKYFKMGLEKARAQYEKDKQTWESPNRPAWARKPVEPPKMEASLEKKLVDFIENGIEISRHTEFRGFFNWIGAPSGDWLNPQQVKLIHLVRLLYLLYIVNFQNNQGRLQLWWYDQSSLQAYRSQYEKPFGLRELDAAVASLPQCAAGIVANAYLTHNSNWQTFCDWEPGAIYPCYAEHPEYLQAVLQSSASDGIYQYGSNIRRQNAFKVLSMFPQVPAEYVSMLWDIALGDGKSDRALAQGALSSVPDKTEKIIVALSDGRANIRAAAAEWLGKLGDKTAIDPIKKAFAREKTEPVKGAFMLALDALHADVDEFLDRDRLIDEAKAGLAKKRPKGMEWVPLDNLPKLHWQDSGQQVNPEIVQWWVVQSIQQKTPHCGPLLRRYLSLCRKADLTDLSRFVLSSWIERDTATLSAEDAAAKAQQDTDKFWSMYGSQKYYQDFYKGRKENLYDQIYRSVSTDCLYSAIDQKGMLALVAPGGDSDCVKISEKYIRKWFGNRLAQCKCLIEVLSSIEHPLALQVLLSIANRFRTKALKQLAEDQVNAIAKEQGWTIDQLADRTIPEAGFERPVDDDGQPVGSEAVLILDFGPRQFEVRLNDNLEPVINAAGEAKPLKNLPAPGKNDDPDKAAAARKMFSDAKKTAREVVKRQTERLYEALCTQRSWNFADWQRYLLHHPIVGRLCVRLAWAAFSPLHDNANGGGGPKFLGCFRPLEDGSLTNEKDEEVKLPDDAVVVLAHTCNTAAALSDAWLKHFEDYDVEPLFQQFGRSTYELPEAKKNENDITDFEGHAISTFKLRGKAGKLGYVRGEAEDGGWFYVYRKPFTSLEVEANIEFTGNFLPEEDRASALTNLCFVRLQAQKEQGYYQQRKIPLAKVPPVLLSECYNDMKQIAAEGSGYDPAWKEKSYY